MWVNLFLDDRRAARGNVYYRRWPVGVVTADILIEGRVMGGKEVGEKKEGRQRGAGMTGEGIMHSAACMCVKRRSSFYSSLSYSKRKYQCLWVV